MAATETPAPPAPAEVPAAVATSPAGGLAAGWTAAPRPLRILLLTHAFNSLAQRLFVALRAAGHQVSVELDIADSVTEEAVALAAPDLVLAPFLKRRIPDAVWSRHLCLVVHPGPPGDRGPSALDWALLQQRRQWGVTVLQATADFDAGPVWAWAPFTLRADATKASLYRHEVVAAAVQAVADALARVVPGQRTPAPPARPLPVQPAPGGWQPLVTQAQRRIDWAQHDAATVLRLVRSADGAPGAVATLFGEVARLYDAHPATSDEAACAWARAGAPGQAVARRGPALLLTCAGGGALWIGQVRRGSAGADGLKLPATLAFAEPGAALSDWPVPLLRAPARDGWDELLYAEFGPPRGRVGWLEFDFHNGALGERACARLLAALRFARGRDTRVLVLAGGADFFCNGIHLHEIEAAAARPGDSAAEASLRAIEAIDDVALALITLTDRLTVSALRGNAGAGGCFLALAADQVWAHGGVVLNPHYRNMGNLHGSEYWTYLLPQRIGAEAAQRLVRGRLPMGADEARRAGLVDAVLGAQREAFEPQAAAAALALAAAPDWAAQVQAKQARRAADEVARPLAAYRADELAQMRRNFFGFDASYHVARHHFVHRKPHAWTPRHLATHRR